MERNNSNAFFVVKAFAALSIVSAHCVYRNTPQVQAITDLFGMVGVPIFLIVAGVFFKQNEENDTFWMKKLKGIIVPWVTFG